MLDKLERRFGRYALANLPILLVAGQVATFALAAFKPFFAAQLLLIPERVLAGEVWRLFTFVFIPPLGLDVDALAAGQSPILGAWTLIILFFEMMLLYTFGRGIEGHWGAFRFNVFLLVAWLATILAACVFPYGPATNVYMMASIMLTFAYLVPDFEILLMFIFPVKIKWLAYLGWAFFAWQMIVSDWSNRLLIVAGLGNFFIFCGRDIYLRARGAGRRGVRRQQARLDALTPTHRCEVCGITDLDDKDMQFRYCSQCAGKRGYCAQHLKEHEHVRG